MHTDKTIFTTSGNLAIYPQRIGRREDLVGIPKFRQTICTLATILFIVYPKNPSNASSDKQTVEYSLMVEWQSVQIESSTN